MACLATVLALAGEGQTVTVRTLFATLAAIAALAFATADREQFCVRVVKTGLIAFVGVALLLLQIPTHKRVLLRADDV